MGKARVDYDEVASGYDQRYAIDTRRGVRSALQSLVNESRAEVVLEAGCGTGKWLAGTYQTDLDRFISYDELVLWLQDVGFQRFARKKVEKIREDIVGRRILDHYFLGKQSTSQLILLSDREYERGLARVKEAVSKPDDQGKQLDFKVDISLYMTTATKGSIA